MFEVRGSWPVRGVDGHDAGPRHDARRASAAQSVHGVSGVDKNYARKTGFKYHVDLHIEVDPGAAPLRQPLQIVNPLITGLPWRGP